VKATVCLPQELGSVELDRWRGIRSGRPDLDNPFLSPEFTLAVGRARPQARVAVVEDGERIVAFFPFERRAFGLGVPIGAGLSDCQAIICEPGIDLDMNQLLAQCGLASWRFDHLIDTERAMIAPTAIEGNSPIVDLSIGFGAYLAGEGHHSRTTFKHERKLSREVGPVRFGFGVDDDEALGKLMEWKSEQYRRTGRPDRFASSATVQLVQELAKTSDPDLSGTLMTLRAGERLVAVEFSLRSQTTLAGWFPSHDPELSHYSPGSIRTLRTIEAAGLAGLLRYDLGKGEMEHKLWLKTGDLRVCEGWVVRPVARGYLRRAMSMPRETLLAFVLRHRRLRLAARATLSRLGSIHTVLARKTSPPSSRT
jgi:CelD/BcsL family acetyltransferase involved in cellulose biosynthesis